MKATHVKGSGELFCYLSITQEINTSMLEQTITVLLEEGEQVTAKAVKAYIANRLLMTGRLFFDYGFWDDDRGVSEEAKELSPKLFPSFYVK